MNVGPEHTRATSDLPTELEFMRLLARFVSAYEPSVPQIWANWASKVLALNSLFLRRQSPVGALRSSGYRTDGCAASLMSAVVCCSLHSGQRAFANTLPCVPNSLLHCLRGRFSFDTVIYDSCLSKVPRFCIRVTRRLSAKAIDSNQAARRNPAERRYNAGDKAVFKQGAVQFYVTCHPGLEEVTAKELAAPNIAAFNIQPSKAGVHFRCASAYFPNSIGLSGLWHDARPQQGSASCFRLLWHADACAKADDRAIACTSKLFDGCNNLHEEQRMTSVLICCCV